MAGKSLDSAIAVLVDRIRETDEFKNYSRCIEEVKYDEEAMDKINRLREISLRIQQYDEDRLNREAEEIEKTIENLCIDSRVSDFMQAEVDFSRLYQRITEAIIGLIDSEIEEG